jgi:hypothetical protein
LSEEEAIEDMRAAPCAVSNRGKDLNKITIESFDRIGIEKWFVFRDEFLMYMPTPILAVATSVSYRQPYRRNDDGHDELTYVFRTGALWSGSIDRLNLTVRLRSGIALVSSSWLLEQGRAELEDVEPESDLLLTIRQDPIDGIGLHDE